MYVQSCCFAFLTFSLPSTSSLLKLSFVEERVRLQVGCCLIKFQCSSNDWLCHSYFCLSFFSSSSQLPVSRLTISSSLPWSGAWVLPRPLSHAVPRPSSPEVSRKRQKQKETETQRRKKGKESKQHWLNLPTVNMSHFQFIETFRFENWREQLRGHSRKRPYTFFFYQKC